MKGSYIIFALLVCLIMPLTVQSAEYSYTMNDIGNYAGKAEWDKLTGELPEDIKAEVTDIDPYDPGSAVDAIEEKSSLKYWTKRLLEEINSALGAMFPDLLPVFSAILILAAVQMLLPTLSSELADSFMMLGRLTVAITVFRTTFGMLDIAERHLTGLCSIMNLLTPVMQALYLAEGSLTQMSVSTTAVMLAVTAIGYVNTRVMAPCTSILFTLSAVTTVCDEVKLGGLTSGIRQLIMRVWQIVTIMFSFMLGTQSIIARSADTLAAKTVKFAIGSFIPMAGGVMAEAYNTVREGLSFVKTTAGIGGIIMILLILLPGIIPLVVYKISIIILSSISGMLKLDGTTALLEEVKGIIEIITAIVLYTSLMLVFAMILFTRSRVG
ncbi:MAG: hypothetical protein J6L96_09375 [Clostridia bacterium]|nr:hypothetical protein [Clostridia bacterium]